MNGTVASIITINRHRGTGRLDPRCKLLLLISIGVVSYGLVSDVSGFLLMTFFALFVCAGGEVKWAVKMVLTYIAVAYLCALLRYVEVPGLSIIMSVFGVTVLKTLPIILMGRFVLRTTHMDDLMVSLQRLKLPQAVIIPLTVLFRYVPTLGIEYRMIRSTMEIRGICDTFWKKLLHPIQTVEYILVPLLMRCLKVSDELAASGTTRGLERIEKRYALGDVRFSVKEYAVTAMAAFVLAGLFIMNKTSIGEIVLWRF